MLYQMLFAAKEFFKKDEEGQGLVEYALIIVLISIVVIVLLGLLGDQINTVFSQITSELANP